MRGMEQAMRGEEGLACFLSRDGTKAAVCLGEKAREGAGRRHTAAHPDAVSLG